MCKKAVVSNKTENKRKRKKPTYLTDTSEEEEKEGKFYKFVIKLFSNTTKNIFILSYIVTEVVTAVTENKDKSPTIPFVHVLPPPSPQ